MTLASDCSSIFRISEWFVDVKVALLHVSYHRRSDQPDCGRGIFFLHIRELIHHFQRFV